MKNLSYILFIIATVICTVACTNDIAKDYPNKNVLKAPEVSVPGIKESSATITWGAIANATSYIYSINDGTEDTITGNTLQLKNLQPETNYTFKVKAQKAGSLYFEDSEYTKTQFTTTAHVKVYKVATFADDWDKWYYDYNDNRTVKRIYRMYDGAIEREWVFAYDDKNITVTGKNNYTMTLNDAGYVTTFVDGSNTYTYTYDSDGYMTKAENNGTVISNITIENGNIMKWSKFSDGVEQFKVHTYSAIPNVGGAHSIYAENAGFSRWLAETGLFGKASTDCHATNQWDYSSTASKFTFLYDENSCIKQESKDYNGYVENYYYTYNSK
jgi:YD repeat-containing protein